MSFHIRKSENNQFYATENANNNKVLNTTETEKRHAGILNNIRSVIRLHGSSKPQKVFDHYRQVTFWLKWNKQNGEIIKFNIKNLHKS